MTDTLKQLKRPSISELKRAFSYDPQIGKLTWNLSNKRVKKGDSCGSLDSNGRVRIQFQGKTYAAHQIAFAMHHGRWSIDQVDHINGDKIDNRIENLREASNAENSRNRSRPKSSTGFKGVTFHKGQKKYNARIMADGLTYNLGSFDSAEEAAVAYNSAAIKYHGQFALLNKIGSIAASKSNQEGS